MRCVDIQIYYTSIYKLAGFSCGIFGVHAFDALIFAALVRKVKDVN